MNRSIRKIVFVVVFSSFVLNLITSRQINSGLNIDIGVTTAQASGSNAAQSLSYNMPYTVQNPNCQQSNNSELSDFDNFSWQSFIALNWPAALDPATGLPARASAYPNGVPDTTLNGAATDAVPDTVPPAVFVRVTVCSAKLPRLTLLDAESDPVTSRVPSATWVVPL